MPQYLSLLIFIVLMTAETVTCETSLSPTTWPQGEFERLERMTLNKFERPKPLAVSAGKGLVAGTTEPFAVHSGMDALRKGGNAMDACLATALTGMRKGSVKTSLDDTGIGGWGVGGRRYVVGVVCPFERFLNIKIASSLNLDKCSCMDTSIIVINRLYPLYSNN